MWLDKLKEMKAESGFTTKEIADKSGIPEPTLEKLFAGATKDPKLATMQQLVHFLGFSLDDLSDEPKVESVFSKAEKEHIKKYRTLDGHGRKMVDFVLDEEAERVADDRRQASQGEGEELEGSVVHIPFRCSTQSASAGTGTYLGPEAFETIYVQDNDLTRRASFGVPVSGDSMEPRYHNGDILVVEGAEEIEPGEIGVFSVDGSGYVKELGDGELISLNPAYDPIPMTESTWCHGRVIGVLDPEWIAEE